LTEALTSRRWLTSTLLAAVAALLGVIVARQSNYAVGLVAMGVVLLLAFRAPVTHLTILLGLTAIVPYTLENRYHAGGAGAGTPGLLASDLFLLTGLIRSATVLPRMRLGRRRMTVLCLVLLFCAFTVFEAYQGLRAGQTVSNVGAEFRTLAGGFATALIAMTVLEDRDAHPRMLKSLALLGLALGLWGIAQWALNLSFAGDFGVRTGVTLTTNGVGQLQGGLFSFPVAVILAVSALVSRQLSGWRARLFVIAVLIVNLVSLLLTFERTFWVITGLGAILVALRANPGRRARALLWLAGSLSVGLITLAIASPTTFQTAQQRLLSIGQYQTDNSVRYRSVESGFVLQKIREKPLFGWGLADTIYWGQPWDQTTPSEEAYTHVGFLWLFWREGFVGGAVLLLLLGLSVAWPGRAAAGDLVASVRTGCQASLVALLIADVTFPAFQGYAITFVMGFLVAYCALPVLPGRSLRAMRAGRPGLAPRRPAEQAS
jgi:hypothetical protein